MLVIKLFAQCAALALVTMLAACAPKTPEPQEPPPPLPGYEALEDGGFQIAAIDPRLMADGYQRTEVIYTGEEKPGTVVVDPFARKLYLVQEGGMAIRYGIAVGREGLSFKGAGVIGRMEKWPSWTPTANMVKTRPDLYLEFAGGMSGGLDNPLGSRALYLYRNGKDSNFRIHGTIDNNSIGHATSAGCIRLYNQDAIDLAVQAINHRLWGTRWRIKAVRRTTVVSFQAQLSQRGGVGIKERSLGAANGQESQRSRANMRCGNAWIHEEINIAC